MAIFEFFTQNSILSSRFVDSGIKQTGFLVHARCCILKYDVDFVGDLCLISCLWGKNVSMQGSGGGSEKHADGRHRVYLCLRQRTLLMRC